MRLLMVCKVSVLALAVGLYGCKGVEDATADAAPVQQVAAQVAGKVAPAVPSSEKVVVGVASSAASSAPGEAAIRAKFRTSLPQLNIVSVEETVAPGIYGITLSSGEELMTNAEGTYIFSGDLLAVQERGILNVSEQNRGKKRVKALSTLKDENLVVFKAEGEEKGEVIAFTDTSCGYCQKFHAEIPELNKLGVTVKYVAWPRYGVQSPAGKVISDVWCAKDRANAMTMAKTRRSVGETIAACDVTALINEQISLGREVGVKGTPALYTLDGRQIGDRKSVV